VPLKTIPYERLEPLIRDYLSTEIAFSHQRDSAWSNFRLAGVREQPAVIDH